MADFTAVIQRAVNGLSDKSPEMRLKVYEKAKTAVQRQLNAMNPPPPEDMIARQMAKLDEAIASIEATFADSDLEPDPPVSEPEVEAAAPEAQPEETIEDERVEAPEPAAADAEEPAAEPETGEVPDGDETPAEPAAEEPEADPEVEAELEAEPEPQPEETEEPQQEEDHSEEQAAEELEPLEEEEPLEAEPVAWEPASADDFVDDEQEIAHVAPYEADARLDEPPYEQDEKAEPVFEDELPAADSDAPPEYGTWPEAGETDPLAAEEWDLPSIDDSADASVEQEPLDELTDVPEMDVRPAASQPVFPEDEAAIHHEEPSADRSAEIDEVIASLHEEQSAAENNTDRSGTIRMIVIAAALLIGIGGIGYAAWQYKDSLSGIFAGSGSEEQVTPAETPATEEPATEGQTTEAPADTGPEKFTQRLLADGSEVDTPAGPAASGEEGKSVAQQSVSSQPTTDQTAGATTSTSDAQNIFLYEERLGQASPTALEGTVVWTREVETQDVGNPQPVIQATIEVPERSMSAMITFKRNADPSLPASHIIELVFSLPENFEGGGIESVVRISMKQREQDQGTPLIGVPARITDYFHMIALNSLSEAVSTNLDLLRSMDWIDIPIVYGNGRRALLTLTKGPGGQAIFNEVLDEWARAGQGQ